jgi:protein-disulfide isomerase
MENDTPPINSSQMPDQKQEQKLEQKKDITKFLTPLAILVAGFVIAGAVVYSQALQKNQIGDVQNQLQAGQQPAIPVDIKDVITQNEPFIGKADAPVTIAYWSDYQCPFCKEFETGTLPSIIKDYVQKNNVKIVFKDFNFLGPDSNTAGLYARSVWSLYPSRFFAWREAMYNKQDAENKGFGDGQSIIALTKTVSGIDAAKIQADVAKNTEKYQEEINADKTEGAKFGIGGTPSFIIGTNLIPGSLPYDSFKQVINALLK